MMEKKVLIAVAILLFLVGCGNKLTEEVVTTHDNGQPNKVYVFNSNHQRVAEKEFYDNGVLKMEGPIVNDVREGEWVSYFPDGKVQSTGIYKDGLRVGKAKVYYENGHLWMDGYYNNDHQCGEWIFYDEQGYEDFRSNYGSCD